MSAPWESDAKAKNPVMDSLGRPVSRLELHVEVSGSGSGSKEIYDALPGSTRGEITWVKRDMKTGKRGNVSKSANVLLWQSGDQHCKKMEVRTTIGAARDGSGRTSRIQRTNPADVRYGIAKFTTTSENMKEWLTMLLANAEDARAFNELQMSEAKTHYMQMGRTNETPDARIPVPALPDASAGATASSSSS